VLQLISNGTELSIKEISMKRSALAGLFVAAALLAPSVFAADDLCAVNLQKIKDAQVSGEAKSSDLQDNIDKAVEQAKDAQKKGTEEGKKDCISLTTQALQDIQNNTKGDQ
jgi:hypothetical protein